MPPRPSIAASISRRRGLLVLAAGLLLGGSCTALRPGADEAWIAGDAAAARDAALRQLAERPGDGGSLARAAWLEVQAGDLAAGLRRLPRPPAAWSAPLAEWIETRPAAQRDSLYALADGAFSGSADWAGRWIRSAARRGDSAADTLFARLRDPGPGWRLALAAGSPAACAGQLERLARRPPRGDFARLLARHPRPGMPLLEAWAKARGGLALRELEALAASGAWAELADWLARRPDDRPRAGELRGIALAMIGREEEALAVLRALPGEGGAERRLWQDWLEGRGAGEPGGGWTGGQR
jgi:hypothetical protein